MTITGYRYGADFIAAPLAFAKHLGISLQDAKDITRKIQDGQSFRTTDDFVLREDLEDLGFIVE